jgi:hypothetical protein
MLKVKEEREKGERESREKEGRARRGEREEMREECLPESSFYFYDWFHSTTNDGI